MAYNSPVGGSGSGGVVLGATTAAATATILPQTGASDINVIAIVALATLTVMVLSRVISKIVKTSTVR